MRTTEISQYPLDRSNVSVDIQGSAVASTLCITVRPPQYCLMESSVLATYCTYHTQHLPLTRTYPYSTVLTRPHRMIAEGHEVGCRGWNGKPFPTMQPDALLIQLKETKDTLFKITGVCYSILHCML
jgi:hypothetical protein